MGAFRRPSRTEPKPPNRRFAHTILLGEVCPFFILYLYYDKNDTIIKGVITCKTMSAEKCAIIADSRPFFQ